MGVRLDQRQRAERHLRLQRPRPPRRACPGAIVRRARVPAAGPAAAHRGGRRAGRPLGRELVPAVLVRGRRPARFLPRLPCGGNPAPRRGPASPGPARPAWRLAAHRGRSSSPSRGLQIRYLEGLTPAIAVALGGGRSPGWCGGCASPRRRARPPPCSSRPPSPRWRIVRAAPTDSGHLGVLPRAEARPQLSRFPAPPLAADFRDEVGEPTA